MCQNPRKSLTNAVRSPSWSSTCRRAVSFLAVAAALSVAAFAPAIDIIVILDDNTSENPSWDANGAKLFEIAKAAAVIWEDLLPDAGTYPIAVEWDDDIGAPGQWTPGITSDTIELHPGFNWYVDKTPFDNDEFDFSTIVLSNFNFGQTLYRDLGSVRQSDWFNGNNPGLLEVGYVGRARNITDVNPHNSNAPGPMGNPDMLTALLHEMGHALGINAQIDFDADDGFFGEFPMYSHHLLGNEDAEVEGSSDGGHLRPDMALMTPGPLAGARYLPSAVDVLAIAYDEDFQNVDLARKHYSGTGNWNDGSRWIGGAHANADDDAYLIASANVTLTANAVPENLFIRERSQLNTQNHTLNVVNLTEIRGVGLQLPRPKLTVPSGGTFNTYDLSLVNGNLVIEGGNTVVDQKVDIGIGGRIEGRGVVSAATLENRGLIRALGGLLELKDMVTANFGGPSGQGVLLAEEGDLKLAALLTADFAGTANISPGHFLESTFPWTLAADGEVNLKGQGLAAARLQGVEFTSEGDIAVTEFGIIEAPAEFASSSSVALVDDAFLWLNGATTFRGGTYTGGGTIVQNGDAVVADDTVISVSTYDLDGRPSAPSTVTINNGKLFRLNVRSIEPQNEGGYDGTMNINSGLLEVDTHVGLIGPGGQMTQIALPWTMKGTLNLNRTGTFFPTVGGSRMIVGEPSTGGLAKIGALNVVAGDAVISAPVTFEAAARVSIPSNSTLRLASTDDTIYRGGVFSGGGVLRQSADAVVEADTHIQTSFFDMDGDGTEDSTITIRPGAELTVSSRRIEVGSNDFDGTLVIQGGTLDMRTHNAIQAPGGQVVQLRVPWRMEGHLQLLQGTLAPRVEGAMMVVGQPSAAKPVARVTLEPGGAILDTDVQLEPRSSVEFEIGGTSHTQFSHVYVMDSIVLGGELAVSLGGGFTPSVGDSFPIITADGGVSGVFASRDVPSLGPDAAWRVTYAPNNVFLHVVDRALLGNFIHGASLFYNNAPLDPNGPSVDPADFAVIATDKVPLRVGETASFANISGYSRGINGLFIDFDDLPGDGAGVDASDFVFSIGNDDTPDDWDAATPPLDVGVLPGAGQGGSDRVYVTFPDHAIGDTWLRVTVKANADTGLATDEDFFFGAAPGETGAGFNPSIVGVDAADLQSIAATLTPLAEVGTELITEPNDLNRDGTVNAFDLQVVAINLDPNVIGLITPQLAAARTEAAVPEPSTFALLLGIVVCLLCSRRIRSFQFLFAVAVTGLSLAPAGVFADGYEWNAGVGKRGAERGVGKRVKTIYELRRKWF